MPEVGLAIPIQWDGGTGNWNIAANWDPNQVPTSVDDVTIPSGDITIDSDAASGTTNIASDPNAAATVSVVGTDPNGNPITWSNSGFNVTLFVGDGGQATLNILSGGLVDSATAWTDVISEVYVDGASASGTPSTWNISGVGAYIEGRLDITNGGLVTAPLATLYSDGVGGGQLTVDGTDPNGSPSTLAAGQVLVRTPSGAATLNVTNGGLVQTIFVGVWEGSSATVSGSGSLIDISANYLRVGGAVDVTNSGAIVADDETEIQSTGTLTVDGGSLTSLGLNNTTGGTLNFLDGTLTMTGGQFAPNAGGPTDDLVLDGSTAARLPHLLLQGGTTANVGRDLYVGDVHQGELTVSGGSTVANDIGYIGHDPNSAGTVTIEDPNSVWNNNAELYLGGNSVAAGGSGALTIGDGATVHVGGELKMWSSGTLNLTGGTLNANSGLDNSEAGTLNIDDGTIVVTNGVFLPNAGGPTDDFIIDGPTSTDMPHLQIGIGATATIGDVLQVARTRNGELTITDGGNVSSYAGAIGIGSVNSTGTVTVSGTDPNTGARSTWHNTGLLRLNRGNSTLQVLAGALVTSTDGSINGSFGSTIATVSGTDPNGTPSTWSNSGLLEIGGGSSDGTLQVSGGGLVESNAAIVGELNGSTGLVTVDGTDPNHGIRSTWNNSGVLTVGGSDVEIAGFTGGDGTLNITGGGLVISTTGYLGKTTGSDGEVTVAGTDPNDTPSTWTNSSSLRVGEAGNGTLNITGGGSVTNTTGYIGTVAGSNGSVNVTDPNSNWANASDLYVGQFGYGAMYISGGGSVANTIGFIGLETGSTGYVTVSDSNSTWINSSSLYVGYWGDGNMYIGGGGAVSNTDGFIGYEADSTGTVTVADPNSTWANSSSLYVGVWGTGTMNITGGSAVDNATGYIGFAGGSNGVVTVSDPNSSWTNSGSLFVGNSGMGTLNITNGGLASSSDGQVGLSAFGGTVTIASTDTNSGISTWDIDTFLSVGGSLSSASGIGVVNINAGGTINLGGSLKIWDGGTVNLNGGTFDVENAMVEGTGAFNFLAGTLTLTDAAGYTVGATSTPVDQGLGQDDVVISAGQTFVVENSLGVPVGKSLTVASGDVTADSIVNDGVVSVLNSTITSTVGLTNNADLVVINATVEGPLVNNDAVNVVGAADFNGLVSGPGDFFGSGTANFNGGVALGASPAEVSVEGNVAFGPTNTLFVDLEGLIPGSEYDVLNIAGDATLAGDLSVIVDPNFALAPGDSFEILDVAGALSGTFDGLPDGALVGSYGGVDLFIDYDAGDGNDVALFTVGLPGDFDGNGRVDAFDFLAWQRDTSIGNLADWEANYGTTSSLRANSATIPEPSTLVLALAVLAIAAPRLRYQRAELTSTSLSLDPN